MLNRISAPKIRRVSAGLAAGAVTAAGLVMAGTPAAQAAPVVLTPVDVNTDATRAAGHNDFLNDGVRVWTEGFADVGPNPSTPGNDSDTWNIDKAAGYFDVHMPLADVGEPTMDWVNNDPSLLYRPGMQLKTDFNGDGDVDGVLVGEPIMADGSEFLGDRWWLAGGSDRKANLESPGVTLPVDGTQPTYRQNIATLDEWRALYPNAQVLEAGWSLGSGAEGDGVIYGMTVGGNEYFFTKNQNETTELLYPSDVDLSETRATGHNDFRPTSGVRVWTESNTSTDKAAGYFEVNEPFHKIGEPSMEWRPNGANTHRPGMQLKVDIDGDGESDGILVGEPYHPDGDWLYKDIAVATNWWLSGAATDEFKALAPSNDGGNGGPENGTLAEWRGALPAGATVTEAGWSLGSGIKGDGVIESITVGLTTYTFTGANRAPSADDASATTVAGGSVSIPLPAEDADGDELTYTIDGQPDEDGVLDHTFAADFIGKQTFDYTVDDGRGGTASGTITVKVNRAPTSTDFVVKPATLTKKKKVKLVITVDSTGAVDGTTFVVKDKKKKVGTGTLDADGKVRFVVGKLSAGKHVLKVNVTKGAFTKPSKAKQTVQVN